MDGPGRSALAVLGTLEVKGRAPKTGYSREQFGDGWVDTDHNGCDSRNDVLARDLTGESFKPGTRECVVASGTLADPYSGKTITFTRGEDTSSAVQIDHVVALSDAWQKGAQQWDEAKRVAFANDDLELLAVDGPLNGQKGDGDAATWLPPNRGYRCTYVARQVALKATWGLWVTAAERDAIAGVLSTCPDQLVPVPVPVTAAGTAPGATANAAMPTNAAPASTAPSAAAPAAPPAAPSAAPPASSELSAPAPDSGVVYANCDAVRAAGAAPVRAGQPGYSRKLDRDGDGVGCE
ncbi:GmrSD restriction endonuclease domain-containing protein [Kineococcus sp. SYSU DK006]|uniref:GmrSD restriction endonuclease domain-containing protein n=1 Tax=Kineococcus sp. SYSU DK006 TaxID=3383127 RepID=UPI003D7E4B8B